MSNQLQRKTIGFILTIIVLAGAFNPHAKSFFSLPAQQRISVGDQVKFNLEFPDNFLRQLSVHVDSSAKQMLLLNGSDVSGKGFGFDEGWPRAAAPGKANMQIRLFGIVPVKNVRVEVLPQTRLVPGGQSVGVLLHSEGVMVVGQSIVEDKSGHKYNPALEAGIEVGDVILKINKSKVSSDEEVARLVDKYGKAGQPLRFLVKRKSKTFEVTVKPVLCRETSRYRIGLYIRDSAAGVGTLSFYNPDSGKYGALGHVITDSDTSQPIDISNGSIVRASIQGIQAGRKGQPGEKIGMFLQDQGFSGSIEKNTKFGIYGSLKINLSNPLYKEPVSIALSEQIKPGPAEMLTVLDGEKIESFSVEVKRILPQSVPDSKGLIIQVTDPRLIRRTGGIIQGMSGSPLIQDGRIIGAVTHVFINDPTKGYGCLIEWMLMEAENGKLNRKTAGMGESFGSLHFLR